MKKLVAVFAAVLAIGYFSACSDALSNDKIAQYVASTAKGNTQSAGAVNPAAFQKMAALYKSMGFTPAGVVTNSDGSITSSETYSGMTFTSTTWTNTYTGGHIRMKFDFSIDLGAGNGSLGMSSDLTTIFYSTNAPWTEIPITGESGFNTAMINSFGMGMYGSISMNVTDKDDKFFSMTGTFGDSLSNPFKYFNGGTSYIVDGSISYTITGTDVGEAITLYYNYNNLTAAAFGDIPSGTVNGYVKQGTRQIDFTIVFNATQYATLTVAGKQYQIDLISGTSTAI